MVIIATHVVIVVNQQLYKSKGFPLLESAILHQFVAKQRNFGLEKLKKGYLYVTLIEANRFIDRAVSGEPMPHLCLIVGIPLYHADVVLPT